MDDKEHAYNDGFPRMPQGLTVIPWVIWAAVIVLVIACTKAWSADARSPEECALIADYGLTARALTISGLDLPKRLEVLDQMYKFDDTGNALAEVVRKASDKSDKNAQDFAGVVLKTCFERQGDISGLLGPAA